MVQTNSRPILDGVILEQKHERPCLFLVKQFLVRVATPQCCKDWLPLYWNKVRREVRTKREIWRKKLFGFTSLRRLIVRLNPTFHSKSSALALLIRQELVAVWPKTQWLFRPRRRDKFQKVCTYELYCSAKFHKIKSKKKLLVTAWSYRNDLRFTIYWLSTVSQGHVFFTLHHVM